MASESRPTFVRRSTAESDKTGARMNHSLIKFQFLFILFRNSIFEAQVKIVFNRADDNDSSFFFFLTWYNITGRYMTVIHLFAQHQGPFFTIVHTW